MAERIRNSEDIGEPQSFGWCYLQFVTPDGVMINSLVHQTDIFGKSSVPYISTSIIENANSPRPEVHYFNRNLQEGSITSDGDEFSAEGVIEENSGNYEFAFDYPGQIVFRGKIVPSSLAMPTKTIYQDETGKKFNWKSIVPQGEFSGELLREGQAYPMRGLAYIDRNWGEARIQDFVRDWVWGNFSDGGSSVTFYDITTRKGERFGELLSVTEAGTTSNRLSSSHLESLSGLGNPQVLSKKVKVSDGQVELAFEISPKRIMRNWSNRNFRDFNASYARWATQSQINMNGMGKEMVGITEHLRVRRFEDDNSRQKIILLTGYSGAGKSVVSNQLATSLGLSYIDSRNVYHKLARELGFTSGREWLKTAGTSDFLENVIDETVRQMSDQPEGTNFVLDAVAGNRMVEKIRSSFPQANMTIVSLQAPVEVREGRIARRQNLDLQSAAHERKFRDGFLQESGVEATMQQANFVVENEEDELERTIQRITDDLVSSGRI